MARPWEDALMPIKPDDDVIMSERAAGASTAAIGRLLGRPKNSIAGRIHRLKLAGRITEILPSPIRRPGDPAPYPRGAVARTPDARPRLSMAVRAPAVTLDTALPIIPFTPAQGPLPMSGQCRFPLWADSERPDHRYCGKPARLGSAYCPGCRAICYAREPRGAAS